MSLYPGLAPPGYGYYQRALEKQNKKETALFDADHWGARIVAYPVTDNVSLEASVYHGLNYRKKPHYIDWDSQLHPNPRMLPQSSVNG